MQSHTQALAKEQTQEQHQHQRGCLARNGHLSVVQYLCEQGANKEAMSDDREGDYFLIITKFCKTHYLQPRLSYHLYTLIVC